jgi:hypothetical protein
MQRTDKVQQPQLSTHTMASPTKNHNQIRARDGAPTKMHDEYAREIESLRAENDALLASIKDTHRRIEATEVKKQRVLEEMHALMAIIAAGEAAERRNNR